MATTPRTKRPSGSVSPRPDLLEDRCLLNGKPVPMISIQELTSAVGVPPGYTELLITGTKNNDSISINDNGTGTAGNIFVSTGDGQEYMSSGAVASIFVETNKGRDNVTYELDGNLQPNVDENIFVGSDLKKGGGSVQFTVNIVGKILDQASLFIDEEPDAKDASTMTVNDSGEVDGSLTTFLDAFSTKPAKRGPEDFNFNSTGTIGTGGIVDAGLVGSRNNDIGSVDYSGTNDGEFAMGQIGNGGNDQLSADLYLSPGSTGTVGSMSNEAGIRGSGKKDRLRYTIYQGTDSTSTTNIYAELVDTSKKSIASQTANVTATVKGFDTVVS